MTEPTYDWVKHWTVEIAAAKQRLKPWHEMGGKIAKRFRDDREGDRVNDTRWNLFTSNIQTQRAILYGQTPKVSVERRWADAQDDLARVGAEILERLLNTDIESDDDTQAEALGNSLNDRLLCGMGSVRVRLAQPETEQVEAVEAQLGEDGSELAPAVEAYEKLVSLDVDVDYVHWTDQLWSDARVFSEVRWWAFRAEMTREALVERFGEDVGNQVPLNAKRDKDRDDKKAADPWSRAEVWEIWSKEHERVFWFVEGYSAILDEKEDPLELKGFWPFPRPMMANLTTEKFLPTPDFKLAQDLYDDIDTVSSRITLLEEAIRVTGVYDKSNDGVKKLLENKGQNRLYPVDNFAMFAEKGGLRGVVDWFPLDQIVNALTSLRDYRRELQDALFQITGMSDIMRGQASDAGATATEQSIKAKFGSVRMQALQDEFARFASETCKLKAQIIARHWPTELIMERCNCANTPDAALSQQAIELFKAGKLEYRIEVKPESVSLQDFAALKAERMEVIMGLSTFLTAAAPLAQQLPSATPYLLQMMQWAVSGLRGSSGMEGILDGAIGAAEQAQAQAAANPQAQPPDPKLLAQQMKGQQDMQKMQMEAQLDAQRLSLEVEADKQREQNQMVFNVQENRLKQRDAAMSRAMMPQPTPGRKP